MQRSFSTRGRPGSFTGEGFPGFPGYAGRNMIRLPEGSYTGDPGPFWQRFARSRSGEGILLVQSAPAGMSYPGEESGKKAGDGDGTVTPAMGGTGSPAQVVHGPETQSEPECEPQAGLEAESGVEEQGVAGGTASEPVPEPASVPPEPAPAPELEPQGEPERKPLIWKAFPE